MKYLKRFILMIQFLTTIPLKAALNVNAEDFGKGLVFAPLAGFIIGFILWGAFYLLRFILPLNLSLVLVIVLYMILTGGLHLDGLGDTFDGLFSNRPKEKVLEIMRDSRVGTNAVLAILGVLLVDIFALAAIPEGYISRVLILMPVAGRIGSLIGAGISKYARSGEGLGKSFIEYCGAKEIMTGTVVYLILFSIVYGYKGLVIGIFPFLTAFVTTRAFSSKIGGATGDILGAVCELNQTFFLIFICIVPRFTGAL